MLGSRFFLQHTPLSYIATMSMVTVANPPGVPVAKKSKLTGEESEEKTICRRFQVKKLSEQATIPTRASSGAAGYDLYRYVVATVWNKATMGAINLSHGHMSVLCTRPNPMLGLV